MISESQERMLAVVEPARWDAVRAVCERWGLPVAVIGRVTADGDIAIVDGGLDATAARSPARSPRPGRALTSDAIVHERVAAPPARRRAAPGARRARRAPATGLPERGHGPGRRPARAARLARTSPSRRAVFEQYDSTVQANTVAGPGPRRRGPAGQGHDARRSSRRPTRNQAVGALDPWLGRGAERRRGDPQRRDHRRPAARRHELPELRRPDPAGGVLAADRGRPRPRPTRAGRSGCRSPAATSRSTTSRRRARSRRRPEIGVVGLLDDVATLRRARRSRARRRRDPARRRGDAGPRRQRLRRAGRRRRRGRPAEPRPRPRAAAPGVRPRGGRPRARRLGPGRVGRRPRGRPRRVRAVGRPRRAGPARRSRGSPAVDLFGESPSRLVVSRAAAPRAGARRCWPASTACRSRTIGDRVGGDAACVIELAGSGATGAAEDRGSRVADALTSPLDDLRHAWEHGLSRALGWDATADA